MDRKLFSKGNNSENDVKEVLLTAESSGPVEQKNEWRGFCMMFILKFYSFVAEQIKRYEPLVTK